MEKSCMGRLVSQPLFIAFYREGLSPSETLSSLLFPRLTCNKIYHGLNGVSRLNMLITSPVKGSKEAEPLKRSRNRIALADAGNETNCKVPLWEDRKQ
ncbi:hypothetical protein [Izhakiella australiensis]|uniref:hypothetical protein n=1 Tax=Izhakiella australiensis TaxID=1926881 RepID=UPI0015907126|nr:hypothetical protein [Izhakiella australiensis]